MVYTRNRQFRLLGCGKGGSTYLRLLKRASHCGAAVMAGTDGCGGKYLHDLIIGDGNGSGLGIWAPLPYKGRRIGNLVGRVGRSLRSR